MDKHLFDKPQLSVQHINGIERGELQPSRVFEVNALQGAIHNAPAHVLAALEP